MEILWGDYYIALLINFLICAVLFLLVVNAKIHEARWFKLIAIILLLPALSSAYVSKRIYLEGNEVAVFLKTYLINFTLLNIVALIRFSVVSGFKAIRLGKEGVQAIGIITFAAIVIFISSGAYYEVFVK